MAQKGNGLVKLTPELQARHEALRKYLPFFHFVGKMNKAKFCMIEEWIKTKKTFTIEVLDKMEKAIRKEYKDMLLLKKIKMPDRIHKIFNVDVVDLCSDPEHEDDDDDVVVIDDAAVKANESTKAADKSQTPVSAASKPSEQNSIENGNENRTEATSAVTLVEIHNYSEPEPGQANTNGPTVTLVEIKDYTEPDKANNNCQEVKPLFFRRNKAPESKSSDTVTQATTTTSSKQHSAATTTTTTSSNHTSAASPALPPNETNVEVASATLPKSKRLDTMSLNELTSIYNNLMMKNGVDLEEYLKRLHSHLRQQPDKGPAPGQPYNENIRTHHSVTAPRSHSHPTQITPFVNGNTFYPPPVQRNCGMAVQVALPNEQKKLNLNDPRILKRLKELQNSPGMTDVVRFFAGNLTNCIILPPSSAMPQPIEATARALAKVTAKRPSTERTERESMSYGEYKRLRDQKEEEERKEAERKKKREAAMAKKANANEATSKVVAPEVTVKSQERVNRVLKELECSFKGYDNLQDYIPKTACGKRRSSISARSAIAAQLTGTVYANSNGEQSLPPKRRRKSLDIRLPENSRETSTPQKSLDDKSKLTINPRGDSKIEELYEHFFNCVVRLKRIKPPKANASSEAGKAVQKATNPTQRNTNAKMTERNTKVCVLCRARPRDLTSHFVMKHATESYVARLTSDELCNLQLSRPFVTPTIVNERDPRKTRFKIDCGICGEHLESTFNELHYHYSRHTGEYSFQCYGCALLLPCRKEMKTHQKRTRCGGKVVTLYQYPDKLKVIYLHCCALCNFVQLNEANVYRHLSMHHDQQADDPAKVLRFVLAAINDATDDGAAHKEERGVELPEPKLLADESAIPVVNEPVAEADETIIPANGMKPDMEESESTTKQALRDLFAKINDETVKTVKTEVSDKETPRVEQNNVAIPMTVIHSMPEKQHPTSTVGNLMEVEEEVPQQQRVQIKRKSRKEFKTYSPNDSFYGLFKCMVVDCIFSTDTADEFLQHLEEHSQSECPPKDRLQCPYCHILDTMPHTLSPSLLVKHIQDVHGHSRYQCPMCSYRSYSSSNVCVHWTNKHRSTEKLQIYHCKGIGEDGRHTYGVKALIENMRKNILKIKCPFCEQRLYALNSLESHMALCNGKEGPAKALEFKALQFSCVFCTKDFAAIVQLRNHLADEHYDERQTFGCRRHIDRTELLDKVENLIVIDLAVQMVDNPIVEPPVQQAPLCEVKDEVVDDQKPSEPELINLNMLMVKPLLLKLTDDTGIAPDRLYQCPWPECGGFFSRFLLWSRHMMTTHRSLAICPHCSDNSQTIEFTTTTNFEQHFEKHRRKLHVCFYCAEACVSDDELIAHVRNAHPGRTSATLKRHDVTCYLNYSYHVMLYLDDYEDELKLLQDLQPVLRDRIKANEEEQRQKMLTQWMVAPSAKWLDDFPQFSCKVQSGLKCRMCSYITYDFNSLFQHASAKHMPMPANVHCVRCELMQNATSWKQVIDHYKAHLANLFICCHCSFYSSDRYSLMVHIRTEHDYRDVPVLTLNRNAQRTLVSISVVLSTGKRTLSQNRCYCCDKQVTRLVPHLKRRHGIVLEYACVDCNEVLALKDSELHQKSKHSKAPCKLCCNIKMNGHLSVSSLHPLHIQILSTHPGDDSDDEIMFLDDDDVVIDEELKKMNSKNNQNTKTEIKCIAIENLLPPPQQPTETPASAVSHTSTMNATTLSTPAPARTTLPQENTSNLPFPQKTTGGNRQKLYYNTITKKILLGNSGGNTPGNTAVSGPAPLNATNVPISGSNPPRQPLVINSIISPYTPREPQRIAPDPRNNTPYPYPRYVPSNNTPRPPNHPAITALPARPSSLHTYRPVLQNSNPALPNQGQNNNSNGYWNPQRK